MASDADDTHPNVSDSSIDSPRGSGDTPFSQIITRPTASNPDSRSRDTARMSMSLGNQTLLQVLHAVSQSEASLPGQAAKTSKALAEEDADQSENAEEEEQEEAQEVMSGEDAALSDQERQDMASSIHAIHRPISFQRRKTAESFHASASGEDPEQQYGAGAGGLSGEEYQPIHASPTTSSTGAEAGKTVVRAGSSVLSASSRRSTLEARTQRRAKLAVMLKDIFGLEEQEDVVAEFPCWLFRSVLLQGYLYLTSGHVCFYAYVRNKEGKVVRSGSLARKSHLSGRYHRHWFVLRDDTFTWYPSATEPYFPDGDVSLQYCTAIEASEKHSRQFKIFTNDRRMRFQTDSEASRDEWVRVLRKTVFQCQNEGESIAVPLETILSIERADLDFVDVLRLRVVDQETGFSIEEYPFCYFSNLQRALSRLQEQLEQFRKEHPHRLRAGHIVDSGMAQMTADKPRSMRTTTSVTEAGPASTAARSTPSMSLQSATPMSKGRSSQSSTPVPQGRALTEEPEDATDGMAASNATMRNEAAAPAEPLSSSDENFSYPPQAVGAQPNTLSQDTSWAGWIRGSGGSLSRVTARLPSFPKGRKVSEVISKPHRAKTAPMLLQHTAEEEAGSEGEETRTAEERFRSHFSMPEKEQLLAVFHVYLFRLLPVYGKLYISNRFVCFRATGMVSKAKMILPLQDIIVVEQNQGSRLGFYGLVLTIKGHEELFFEVSSRSRCSQIRRLLADSLDRMKEGDGDAGNMECAQTQEFEEAERLRKLEPSISWGDPTSALQSSTGSVPPVMFRSDSSSYITFRPSKPLHITCLTIGSRGDVQPYIALCKGLLQEGHQCRIASHAEYRDWIEGHGIEFKAVGGDPAELMRICVDNGMFTVSFLREGIAKFRGWLDDLLRTAWDACQGTDLLIESPSAMAGIHIAEALQIPYYRAFTMPWSKTRAYPHAFAVPERKLGGQYNHLSYALFDSIFWKAISGQINRWRKQTLGLHSTSQDQMEAARTPFLYNFSTAIVPPPLDWPEWIHITGYWFLEQPDDSATKKWAPDESLVAFLKKARSENKKIVYIGFGSIVVSDPEALTKTVSDAVQKSDVYAIVSKGWSDRLASTDDSLLLKKERADQEAKERSMMTDRIYAVSAIPHDWLFDRIDAACHHGGAGTTGASLRAGIPTIIRPFFGDQFFWAARMESLGIGTSLRKMTVDSLASALKVATTDEKQVARAKLVGQHIRAENGVASAIESIYRDLEYAKTLIKRNTRRESIAFAPTTTIASRQAPATAAGSRSGSRSRSRPTSGLWVTGNDTSDEGSGWDHLSRGSRAEDTDDDILSRSGIGSSPILSPSVSEGGDRKQSSSVQSDFDETNDDDDEFSRHPSRLPRRDSEGTARSPQRHPHQSRLGRLSAVLPASLALSKSREH